MGEVLQRALGAVTISEVWAALGGGPLRHGRGRAFWRDGDGFNISLNDEKAAWHDHAGGAGGGIIDLIICAQGGTRGEAARWLCEFAGVPMDSGPVSNEERRAFARRRAHAEAEAKELLAWKNMVLEDLRELRQVYIRGYHEGAHKVRENGADHPRAGLWTDIAICCERSMERFDEYIDNFSHLPAGELLKLFRRRREGARAA